MKCNKCNILNYIQPKPEKNRQQNYPTPQPQEYKPDLNYVQPKSKWTAIPKVSIRKPAKPVNIIRIKLADNPKNIVIKFDDKETLIKSLREVLGL